MTTETQQRILTLGLEVVAPEIIGHTPGPWTIGGDGADVFGPGTPPEYHDSVHVADCQDEPGLLGMGTLDVKNAALIARAPDMVAAWVASELERQIAGADCATAYADNLYWETGCKVDDLCTYLLCTPYARILAALVALGRMSIEQAKGLTSGD